MGNFLVRYASRVVIYDHRAVIRLATDGSYGMDTKKSLITARLLLKRKDVFMLLKVEQTFQKRGKCESQFEVRREKLDLKERKIKLS